MIGYLAAFVLLSWVPYLDQLARVLPLDLPGRHRDPPDRNPPQNLRPHPGAGVGRFSVEADSALRAAVTALGADGGRTRPVR
ncbi:hypothetical protein FMEAI12_5540006 [Parafrankia sp. Ea1.12]|nr:hypothetical protein FMEAI12_5540006 [Parafrankia sp. Ea1.12]